MSGPKIREEISDDGAPNEVLDWERREAPWLHGGPAPATMDYPNDKQRPLFHLLTVKWLHGGPLGMSLTAFLVMVSQRMAPSPTRGSSWRRTPSFAGAAASARARQPAIVEHDATDSPLTHHNQRQTTTIRCLL